VVTSSRAKDADFVNGQAWGNIRPMGDGLEAKFAAWQRLTLMLSFSKIVRGAFGDDEGDVVVLLGGAERLDLFDD
jgi:hypothetical protein